MGHPAERSPAPSTNIPGVQVTWWKIENIYLEIASSLLSFYERNKNNMKSLVSFGQFNVN